MADRYWFFHGMTRNSWWPITNIPESSCLIVSTVESKQSILPNSILSVRKINDFLWANKQAVIVITNLEYLISIIDFDIALRMLRDIIDNIRSSDHLLLVQQILKS